VISHDLVGPAASAVLQKDTTVKLALWHGINPMLVLSVITVGLGVAAYVWRERLGGWLNILDPGSRVGPARIYQEAVDGLPRFATAVTSVLQSGYLRVYLTTIVVVTVGLVGFTLASRVDAGGMWRTPDVRIYEILVAGMILAGALGVTLLRSRMASVAALGTVGYGIALLYVLFSAPDLAMTQFAIETLTVLLFVFVIYRLPKYATLTTRRDRVRDAIVALSAGAMMTTLVLIVTAEPLRSRLTPYFAENSLPLGKGRNIVNVILVDFRGFDTLGEITVLSVAAIGVYALMKLRLGQAGDEEDGPAEVASGEER
jgi:multicomponent Na+:H+ antiporter subunit A